MLQPTKALTWEYFRESGWLLVAVMSMVILGPIAFGMLIGLHGVENLHPDDQPMRMYISFLGCAALAFLTPPLYAMTTTAPRNRGLPISTPMWAGVMFVLSIIVVVLSNVLTQLVYLWHANMQWPIVTTTVSLGAFAALIVAFGWWLRDFRGYKLLLGPAVVAGWTYWLLLHFLDARLRGPVQMWDTLSATDVIIFGGTVAASWFVMLRACSRYRCGEADGGWLFLHFLSPQSSLLHIMGDLRTCNTDASMQVSPQTPAQALKTMNWENSRIYMTVGNVLIPCSLVAVSLLVFRGRGNPLAGCGAMILMFSGMAGFVAGQDIWMRKTGGMRPFLGTLPISDKDFARTMLQSSIKASLINWSSVLLSGCVLLAAYAGIQGVNYFQSQYEQLWLIRTFGHWGIAWYFAATGLSCWVCAGIMRAISSTGRMMMIVWAVVLGEGAFVVVFFLLGLGNKGVEWAQRLGEGVAVGLAIIFGLLITVYCFTRAMRRGLVTNSQTLWSAVIVAVLCSVMLTILPSPTVWKIVGCCGLCLVVAPVAAIPCAIEWNRHR